MACSSSAEKEGSVENTQKMGSAIITYWNGIVGEKNSGVTSEKGYKNLNFFHEIRAAYAGEFCFTFKNTFETGTKPVTIRRIHGGPKNRHTLFCMP